MIALAHYALRSLGRRPVTAALLSISLGIAFGLPGAVRAVVSEFQAELHERADAAPLVLGAAGSRSDLVLHALYFRSSPPGTIQVADKQALDRQKLADTIPLCVQASIRDVPVVGTDGSYFALRKIALESGQPIQRIGDCVVGARAAKRLAIIAGESVATSPGNLFGGNGGVPVRLRVTGVLASTGTADDDAAFVSLNTAWLIAGLGHAHSNPNKVHAPGDPETSGSGFIEITDDNVAGFHFHGRPERFPLTAVIVLPHSEQDRLLLLARFATRKSGITLAESDRVLRDLFDVAVRVRTLFDATSAVMAVATLLLCMTVVALTVRLRRSEVTTMSRIGLSSVRIGLLFGFELLFVILVAAGIAALLVTASDAAGPWIFERLVQ